jgi:hypothetical protein
MQTSLWIGDAGGIGELMGSIIAATQRGKLGVFTLCLKRMRLLHLQFVGALSIIAPLGLVAQLVEQRIENPCVGGSIPPRATKNM